MVRFISTRDPNGSNQGESFRVGETVFLVTPPAVPRAQSHTPGLSLTSLTMSTPTQQDEQTVEPAPQVEDEPTAAEDYDDVDEGDELDSAQMTGTELLAPPPTPSVIPLDRRPDAIVPAAHPAPSHGGLAFPSADGIYAAAARREEPSRRRSVAFALILLLLVAGIGVTVYFQQKTQRELQALRASLNDQQQKAGNLVLDGVRAEIRALPLPNPQDALDQAERTAQAILELKQTMADRTQKADGQTQQLSQVIRQELAEHKRDSASLDEVKEPILTELREMKDALAELRSRPAHVPAATVATAAVPASAVETTADASPTSPAPAVPDASAVLAQAQLRIASQPAERPGTIYLVDATGSLKDMVPEALAEVRRLMHQQDGDSPYVLMLYSERLVRIGGLPQSRGASTENPASPVVDLGPADLAAAVKIALEPRPRTLHILSDTLAGGEKIAEMLQQQNRGGTRIDATQFHNRQGQDAMKRIAREHNGMYSFIPGSR